MSDDLGRGMDTVVVTFAAVALIPADTLLSYLHLPPFISGVANKRLIGAYKMRLVKVEVHTVDGDGPITAGACTIGYEKNGSGATLGISLNTSNVVAATYNKLVTDVESLLIDVNPNDSFRMYANCTSALLPAIGVTPIVTAYFRPIPTTSL